MTMQNNNLQPKPSTPVKKDWASMSKQERHDFSIAKKAQAISKVQEGDFPAAVRVRIADQITLLAKPSGVSEKGSVSYSVSPTILTLGNKQVRINKLNLSVLATGMEGLEEIDLTDSNVL